LTVKPFREAAIAQVTCHRPLIWCIGDRNQNHAPEPWPKPWPPRGAFTAGRGAEWGLPAL